MANDKSREQALKARVGSEREAAGKRRVRFSRWVRQEAVELVVASRMPQERFAGEMGIGKTSLQRWVRAAQGKQTARKPRRARFRRVELQSPASGAAGIEVVFPTGARIVGLTLADVRQLLEVTA